MAGTESKESGRQFSMRFFKAALARDIAVGGTEVDERVLHVNSTSSSSSPGLRVVRMQSTSSSDHVTSHSNPLGLIQHSPSQSMPLPSFVIKLLVADVTVVITVDVEVGAGVVG